MVVTLTSYYCNNTTKQTTLNSMAYIEHLFLCGFMSWLWRVWLWFDALGKAGVMLKGTTCVFHSPWASIFLLVFPIVTGKTTGGFQDHIMPLKVWPPNWPFSLYQHSIGFSRSHMTKVNIVQVGKYIPPSTVDSIAQSYGKRHGCTHNCNIERPWKITCKSSNLPYKYNLLRREQSHTLCNMFLFN